jgi:glycosyltransferase involved in cell wall biosynthesis
MGLISHKPKVLFVCWDGPDSNYHESLFLPIFDRCRQSFGDIHLLQYTWDAHNRTQSIREAASQLGMPYVALPVWRTPQAPATAAMIVRGAFDLVHYVRRHSIDVLMPRSIIPAGMALLALHFLSRTKLLFDADGLMADERADFGGWNRKGKTYRIFREIESAAVRRADVVITRTRRAKRILAERAGIQDHNKIMVVSNGKDALSFRPGSKRERADIRRELGLTDETTLIVYAGSLGPHYHPDRMSAFAAAVRKKRPDTHLLLLTTSPDIAHEVVRACRIDRSGYTVKRLPPGEVPHYLAAADLGLAFRTPNFSQQAVAPIKVGEYLLCGLPVLSTSGIGDLDDQLDAQTGMLLDRLDDAALNAAAAWFTNEVLPDRDRYRNACRERGLNYFSLDRSAEQYRYAFQKLDSLPS